MGRSSAAMTAWNSSPDRTCAPRFHSRNVEPAAIAPSSASAPTTEMPALPRTTPESRARSPGSGGSSLRSIRELDSFDDAGLEFSLRLHGIISALYTDVVMRVFEDGRRRDRWPERQVAEETGGRRDRWPEGQVAGGTGGRRNGWPEGRRARAAGGGSPRCRPLGEAPHSTTLPASTTRAP